MSDNQLSEIENDIQRIESKLDSLAYKIDNINHNSSRTNTLVEGIFAVSAILGGGYLFFSFSSWVFKIFK